MNKFTDNNGKESMMRKITFILVWVFVAWGTTEIGYSMFKTTFQIHTEFLLGTLSIVVVGKVGQAVSERIKK